MKSLPVVLLLLFVRSTLFAADPIVVSDSDWPWWRGPTRDGKALAGQKVPVRFGPQQNVIWKVPVNGRGHGSPTVVGNTIFLSTADEVKRTQSVIALERRTGKQCWETVVNRGAFPEKIHRNNTHASATIGSDGKRAFVIFYNNNGIQLAALNFDGSVLWEKQAGTFFPQKYEFGYGASPLIHGDHVIVAADYEKGGFLAAFDRNTGREAWRSKRKAMTNYASPVVATIAGKEQILLGGNMSVNGYDLASGNELWSAPGPSKATCASLVTDGVLIFSSGGFPEKFTVAVNSSGQEVWRNNQKSYEQSMLWHDGFLYTITDAGIAYCWRGNDGKEMWRQRLKGPVSASPVLVGDVIYQCNEKGTFFVFKANPERFELLSENQVGESSFATLSVCGGRIYVRVAVGSGGSREEILYCFGE